MLLCARGQRGKSTLAVLAMLNGMDYVSDDYLFLEKDDENNIFASPIYSIITLSPYMTSQLGSKLDGTIKLGDNARKDKYVFNIANKHDKFRKHYPVKCIMFPEIIDSDTPIIREATGQEKARALTQLVHSTTSQMNDTGDRNTTKKLISMVNDFKCYYIGLSRDVELNSRCLIQFMNERNK